MSIIIILSFPLLFFLKYLFTFPVIKKIRLPQNKSMNLLISILTFNHLSLSLSLSSYLSLLISSYSLNCPSRLGSLYNWASAFFLYSYLYGVDIHFFETSYKRTRVNFTLFDASLSLNLSVHLTFLSAFLHNPITEPAICRLSNRFPFYQSKF